MPVEVEREQGEVSVKVDMENAAENKQEVVAPISKEDVGDVISNNGNGNEKEDTDGSYVFVTENDTVVDDSVVDDSVKAVDDAVVEKDLKEGEVLIPEEGKKEPEEVVEIPKSETEDLLEKSVDHQNPGNGHLEVGLDGKVESIEEVELVKDSDVGSRDIPENIAGDPADLQGKAEDKVESEIKTDVEGDQGDIIEAKEKSDLNADMVEPQEKSDLAVDVSEDLKHSEDVAETSIVDSDVGSESKVSPTDPSDGGVALEQPTLTDPADTVNGSETVNDRTGSESESVAVSESVSAENGHTQVESEVEKTGDEAEKVNASDSDVLPDSGTLEVGVSEVSSDVPAESQTLTAATVESHTSGEDGFVENGNSNSESEAIQDSDVVENSKVQSEAGAVDASDGSMTTHQESQDASEPACDQDGKQDIASEVTEVLDAPASQENSDAVIVSEDNVFVAPISDDVSCPNQQESERGEISGTVEEVPSHELHEDATSGNDTSVNLKDDSGSQGFSENHAVDKNQEIQDDCSVHSKEVTDVNEKHAPVEKVEENNCERNLDSGSDVGVTSAEEVKELPTGDLSGSESADTISTNINGSSSLLDSKTAVPELAESSAEGAVEETGPVATKSEAAQPVKESTEPHVAAPAIQFGEISREVLCGSEVNVTTPVDVCVDTPSEEVPEINDTNVKDRSVMETDEVDSNTESFDSTKAPVDNNDIVKVSKEEDSREENNETDGATASVASETKTCAQDLESKVVTSSDTIHTGATDCVDRQHVEIKEGDATKTDEKVEGSALDSSEGHTVVAEIEKRPFYFLPKVPRYDDEKLADQLKHAEAQVEQKTQSRDALKEDIQKIRATCKEYDISYKAAMAEERSARKAMHSKRQEIDALQSVISRVKSAASVDDIDSKVNNMEHTIQHETLSLSEEKGIIREIKQLKQLRGQISSSMGTKDEVKQALDDKEKTEERVKVLRKELDVLRNELSKVEAVTKAAKKKCDGEWEVQNKLQQQFKAADAVRQEAFVHLQELKKQQREKNKYFFKYKDDSRAANEMALKKDRAALQSLCSDQVENFMNMWNNNEEFRSYYVRCNTRSTLRRLGTLDGRSLGPDEEPPRITYAARTDKFRTSINSAEKHETAPPVSAKQEKVVKYEGSKVENSGKDVPKPAEQKSQTTKPKKAKPDQPPQVVKELVSAKEETEKSATKEEEEKEETPKLTKEEEEQIKKEEEKRKQKEAAKLKEQHRLEEIAKAKEAMERKKKREEKAKARAALKAQKEAEEKEKEREKKLRKKERRKGVITSDEASENPTETSEAVIETPREIEIPKKQTPEESQQIKKSHKPSSQFLKQNKSKSIPLPLRNRGSKKKLRQWMWIGLIVLVALALFLLGNANLSFSPENLWFI